MRLQHAKGKLWNHPLLTCNITVTPEWERWRLKSPASWFLLNRLFRHRSKKNLKAPRHWPWCGEFTGDRWIPRTKGQWCENCFHFMTSWFFSDIRDGTQRTGLFCAAMFIADQLQAEQDVDIFHAVRRVQGSRRQFLQSEVNIWCTTVTSHERHGGSNRRQCECLFRCLFKLTTKQTLRPHITGLS